MSRVALVAVALVLAGTARAKDRACMPADVARFEGMLGGIRKGQFRTDPRFSLTIHYLGTAIIKGTCNVQLRPAD